jgi:ABC-2 type transport system permease protein
VLAYVGFEVRRALRNPRFLVIVALVPVLLYLLGAGNARNSNATIGGLSTGTWFLASSASFGVLAAALGASGARLAVERASGWTRQLLLTPLSELAWLTGRVLVSVVVSIPIVAVVSVLAVTVGGVSLDAREWVQFIVTLLLGAIPLALCGLAVGLALKAEAAQAAQALLLVGLAFLGGLFAETANGIPSSAQWLADAMPTFYLVKLAREAVAGLDPRLGYVGALGLITLVLGALVARLRRSLDLSP